MPRICFPFSPLSHARQISHRHPNEAEKHRLSHLHPPHADNVNSFPTPSVCLLLISLCLHLKRFLIFSVCAYKRCSASVIISEIEAQCYQTHRDASAHLPACPGTPHVGSSPCETGFHCCLRFGSCLRTSCPNKSPRLNGVTNEHNFVKVFSWNHSDE